MEYSERSSGLNPSSIEYKTDETKNQVGLGVRFIDPKKELMSFFIINYDLNSEINQSVSAHVNQQSINLNQSAAIDERKLSLSIGFGIAY